ncbi:MAG: group II intron reverse transcriptase/maturase [Ignavibacteriae bacterium 37-53-5]|nr:MAG: group II intron reverse transcriptase/maturase [Ignavibacteriae bacterium 37-53-5]
MKESTLRELTSTENLQELQRKLYEKAKAEPKFRFYSLYDKTYRADVLAEAYRKVKVNGGTSGIDGETCAMIEEQGLEEYLAGLQLEMKEKRYKPQPVRRVYIPKANGKKRPLGIPIIRDRILQTAFLMVIEPIFEADFAETSYGFRPNRSAHDAIREIYKYLNWGCVKVYDVDLEKYFDTVEHHKLMKLVARRIVDKQMLRVIKQWLSCGYIEDGQHKQSKRGTPQGGVISPLLANIYLNPVDQAFKRSRLGTISKGSIHLVRYADDMVLLAQNELDKGIALLEHYLGRLGLALNKEKTHKLSMEEGGSVNFLGFRFHTVRSGKTGGRFIMVSPSPKSRQHCRERICQLVHHSIPKRVKDQVQDVNQFLRGWVGYFRPGHGSEALNDVRHLVNKRVRRVIQRRHGQRGYGWGGRITSDYLYGTLGLFYDYRVRSLSVPHTYVSGKPYEGKPHVRFDEGSIG